MDALTEGNVCYGGNFEGTDFIGGGLGGTYLTHGQCGGGGKRKKRKQTRTKKKRGASKRKNKKVSTLRKKRGSSKRKNRGSFKRRKHSKREVVKSIMKGLGEKRKSRKKSIKGRGGGPKNPLTWMGLAKKDDAEGGEGSEGGERLNPFKATQYRSSSSEVNPKSGTFSGINDFSGEFAPKKIDPAIVRRGRSGSDGPYGFVSINAGIGE